MAYYAKNNNFAEKYPPFPIINLNKNTANQTY